MRYPTSSCFYFELLFGSVVFYDTIHEATFELRISQQFFFKDNLFHAPSNGSYIHPSKNPGMSCHLNLFLSIGAHSQIVYMLQGKANATLKKTPQLQHNVSQKHPQKGINLHDTNKGLRLRYGSLSAFVVMLDFLVARFLVLLLLLSSEIVGNLILRTGLIFSGFSHSLFSSYIFLLSFLSSSR